MLNSMRNSNTSSELGFWQKKGRKIASVEKWAIISWKMDEYSGKSRKTVFDNSPTPHHRFEVVIVSVYDRNVYKK